MKDILGKGWRICCGKVEGYTGERLKDILGSGEKLKGILCKGWRICWGNVEGYSRERLKNMLGKGWRICWGNIWKELYIGKVKEYKLGKSGRNHFCEETIRQKDAPLKYWNCGFGLRGQTH